MPTTIEDRIAALEAELARLRSGTIETRHLHLLDEAGRVRGVLGVGDQGPTLEFFDERGVSRAKLVVESNGPGLTLADDAGHTRAWLGFAKESLRIGFADEQGNARAFFGVMKNSGPVVRFYDEAQRVIWTAPESGA